MFIDSTFELIIASVVITLCTSLWYYLYSKKQPFLNGKKQSVCLIGKEPISDDTYILYFRLPGKSMYLGLPTGKHVKLFAPNKTFQLCNGMGNLIVNIRKSL